MGAGSRPGGVGPGPTPWWCTRTAGDDRRRTGRAHRARGAHLDTAGRNQLGGDPREHAAGDRGTGTAQVADRYALDRELPSDPTVRTYRAWDTTLDRRVRVTVMAAGDARAAEFLDAGRRAAMFSDPHLPRVLDAGTDLTGHGLTSDAAAAGATAYVVQEDVEGATLTELLRSGPLAPAAVRALVGEVAAALDVAARRGLHHTRLTPDSVVLGADGVVRVVGVGVEAALEVDPPAVSPVRAAALANRADAVGLVALVHAGLTGHWPVLDGITPSAALPASPSADGVPVPPKDLRPDVPNDLDTLCAVTFGPNEDGPRDAGELALQLAPWSMDPWQEVLRRMRGERATAEVRGRLKNRQEVVPEAEPPVPFVRPHSTGRPQQSDSRFVLALVGVVVVVGIVLALWQLSRIGVPQPVGAGRPVTASAPAPTTAAPAPTTAAAPVAGPVPVVAVSALDPEGGGESTETAVLVTDGDPATTWQSQRYNSPAFGGLKSGIGLLLDLGVDTQVTSVAVTMPGEGGSLELRTAPGPAVDGSVVVAAAAASGGQVLTPPAPVTTRYLVLWFTQLATVDGVDRVGVSEVQVVGAAATAP